jgi:hypothetical protein
VSVSPRKTTAVTTAHVRESLVQLQSAVREALASVPGIAGPRPVDLEAALGIDLKLAWKVARIAQSGDPFACVRHLPGAAGWRIALAAMTRAEANAGKIARAAAAFDAAVATGTRWAGDRKAFDMMAAGLASGSDMRIDVEHRRQLHLGGSYVWGLRARLSLRVDILGPGARKGLLDCATLRGIVDLEHMRADAGWVLEAPFVVDDRGTKPVPMTLEALDGEPGARAPHILRDFSTAPLPALQPVAAMRHTQALELAESTVGTEGRLTILQGSVVRSVQPVKTSRRHHGIFQLFKQRVPVERTVFDLVVHRSLLGESPNPEAILYSDLNLPAGAFIHQAKDRIPAGIGVDALGPAHRRQKLAHYDRYAELLGHAFERTGWDPAEYRVFRAEAAYLPVPSTLALELPFAD